MPLKEKPSPVYRAHLDAIQSGEVTRRNVTGIRKLLNGAARREAGLSTGATTPKGTVEQAEALVSAIHKYHPRVVGELHTSGIKVLQNPRYKSRWTADQARIVAKPLRFELVDYEWLDGFHTVPIYRVWLDHPEARLWFDFRNIPWQSGGDGPEVVADGHPLACNAGKTNSSTWGAAVPR